MYNIEFDVSRTLVCSNFDLNKIKSNIEKFQVSSYTVWLCVYEYLWFGYVYELDSHCLTFLQWFKAENDEIKNRNTMKSNETEKVSDELYNSLIH